MITGVRGSGKTVFMSEIAGKLAARDDWVAAELNSTRDLLLNLDGRGKKILIAIDEVSNTQSMREFAAAFQIFVRKKLPVYLIMTGSFENINTLQNEKNLTFLYRAPKIELGALNMRTISKNYKKTFSLKEDIAVKMAKTTKGYPFAFQVLGYFTWEHEGDYRMAEDEYRQYLEDCVYEKIWSELSRVERNIVYAAALSEDGKILGIRQQLGMETNQFNPYRRRLIRKGIINGDGSGPGDGSPARENPLFPDGGSVSGINQNNLNMRNIFRAACENMAGTYWHFIKKLGVPEEKITRIICAGGVSWKTPELYEAVGAAGGRPWTLSPVKDEAIAGMFRILESKRV